MQLPDDQAGIRIRAMLPMYGQFFEQSEYQSEWDGKIQNPAERLVASKKLAEVIQDPTELAKACSDMNKTGALHKALRPPTSVDDRMAGIENFANRLRQAGY
jgi:hypothetical protein